MITILEELNMEKKIQIAIDAIFEDRQTISKQEIGFLLISLVHEAAISAYERCLLDQPTRREY